MLVVELLIDAVIEVFAPVESNTMPDIGVLAAPNATTISVASVIVIVSLTVSSFENVPADAATNDIAILVFTSRGFVAEF